KHGMQLAAISGVNGPFTDDDIARVRSLALAARAAAQDATRRRAAPRAAKGKAARPPRRRHAEATA
ncbi:MAG TPA: hypothetical protein VFX05_06215, partial [Casimicrobiaceae bacterium]|nr:hypothetical protein [Casimicrobiaceae bacterium]